MEEFETTAREIESVQREPLEFIVNDDFVKRLPQIISNIDEIKAEITERTETDRNLVLTTQEDFDKARKRCADLNKVAEAIDKKRREVKKEYNKPYELFDAALKDTVAVITSAKDNLWKQITDAENAVKERKEEEYRDYYAEVGEFVSPYRTWEQIFRKEWLNKGYSREKVRGEINDVVKEIQDDLDTIDSLKSEFAPALYEKYKSGANLKEVIAYGVALQDAKKREETRKALERTTDAQTEETRAESNVAQGNGTEEETVTVDFRVTCTKKQLTELKNFLNWNNIKYGRVPKGE